MTRRRDHDTARPRPEAPPAVARPALGRRRVLVGASAAAAALLAACGGAAGDTADDPSGDVVEDVELRMTWWGDEARHEATVAAIELFEERNPGVAITPEFSGFDGYFDRLATQTAGGNAPDLIQMDFRFLTEYASREALLDLSPYVGEQLDTSGLAGSVAESGAVDGTLYAVPLGVTALSVIVDAGDLGESGVERPDDDTWTWEDLAAVAAEVPQAREGDYWGVVDAGGQEPAFEAFLIQRGKALFDGAALGFSEEDLLAWWELWEGMRAADAAPPPDVSSADQNTAETSGLTTDQAAMLIGLSSRYGGFAAANPTPLELLRIPGDVDRSGTYLKPSMFLSGAAGTEHPEVVAEFIDFMINDPEAVEVLGIQRGIPAVDEARVAVSADLPAEEVATVEFIDALGDDVAPTPSAPPPGAGEVVDLFMRVTQEVAFGQVSPEEAAARFFAEAPGLVGS
ncbi:MAG: ABC transporter substrate-binding protein [Kineosporiaceae bacterium]